MWQCIKVNHRFFSAASSTQHHRPFLLYKALSMYTTMTFPDQTQVIQPQLAWPLHPDQYIPAEHCVPARILDIPQKTVTVSRMYKFVTISKPVDSYDSSIPLVEAVKIHPSRPVLRMYDSRTGTPILFVNNM